MPPKKMLVVHGKCNHEEYTSQAWVERDLWATTRVLPCENQHKLVVGPRQAGHVHGRQHKSHIHATALEHTLQWNVFQATGGFRSPPALAGAGREAGSGENKKHSESRRKPATQNGIGGTRRTNLSRIFRPSSLSHVTKVYAVVTPLNRKGERDRRIVWRRGKGEGEGEGEGEDEGGRYRYISTYGAATIQQQKEFRKNYRRAIPTHTPTQTHTHKHHTQQSRTA